MLILRLTPSRVEAPAAADAAPTHDLVEQGVAPRRQTLRGNGRGLRHLALDHAQRVHKAQAIGVELGRGKGVVRDAHLVSTATRSPAMFLFRTVTGRVNEVRRHVNGLSHWAHWGNWRERHEFWLAGKGIKRGRPTRTTLDTSLDRADNGDLVYPEVRTAVVLVETQRPDTDGIPARSSSRMRVRRR